MVVSEACKACHTHLVWEFEKLIAFQAPKHFGLHGDKWYLHLDSCYDRQSLDERVEYDLHTPFDLFYASLQQHSLQACCDSHSSHIRFTKGSDA